MLSKGLVARATLLLSLVTPSIAHANLAACGAIICLSNLPGMVPAQCRVYRQAYFIIQIWSPYYNAPATALARQQYLATCTYVPVPSGNITAVLTKINSTYGMLMYDPGT